MIETLAPYKKSIITFIGAVGGWGLTAAADNQITLQEWFGLLVAIATTFGVAVATNGPAPKGGKH
jgi:hypothetical protein